MAEEAKGLLTGLEAARANPTNKEALRTAVVAAYDYFIRLHRDGRVRLEQTTPRIQVQDENLSVYTDEIKDRDAAADQSATDEDLAKFAKTLVLQMKQKVKSLEVRRQVGQPGGTRRRRNARRRTRMRTRNRRRV